MKRVGLVLLGCLFLSFVVLAGHFFTNDTGVDATGLRVVFSEPVSIDSFGDAFTEVAPSGAAREFVFSGGVVTPWGGVWFNQTPADVAVESVEWLAGAIEAPLQTALLPATQLQTSNWRPEYDAVIGAAFDRLSSDGIGGAILIPNLGIESEELRMRYTTFLELLRRNTGNELETVRDTSAIIGPADSLHHGWGNQITTVDVGGEWSDMSRWAKQVLDEINAILGRPYFRKAQGSSAKWVFDYSAADWKEDRIIEESTTLSPAGDPLSCRFRICGIFRFENDFKSRFRAAVVRTILLYADSDPALLSRLGYDSAYFERTEFSADFVNLLSVLAELPNGRDFAPDQNEVNRSPVAVLPGSVKACVGDEVMLSAEASFDVDGEVVGYRWLQLAPTKLGADYTTSQRVQLERSDSSTALFTPQWPGTYRFQVSVEDSEGAASQRTIKVDAVWRENLVPRYRGIGAAEYYEADSYRPQEYATWLQEHNVSAVTLCPVWFSPDPHSTEIRRLTSSETDVPRVNKTIPDELLSDLIAVLQSNGISVVLKPMLELDGWKGTRGEISPTNWTRWFQSYDTFILHYARLAATLGVEMLCIGAELDPAEHRTSDWNELIDAVRRVYSGPLTYATNTILWQVPDIGFWDRLDYIGLSFYAPGSGSLGPSLPRYGTGELDPTIGEMVVNIGRFFDERVKPLYDRYRKPVIFIEVGCSQIDGGNQQPWVVRPGADTMPSDPGVDLGEQADWYEAVLQFSYGKEWFAGLFWWEVPMKADYNYQLSDYPYGMNAKGRPVEEIIRLWFDEEGCP